LEKKQSCNIGKGKGLYQRDTREKAEKPQRKPRIKRRIVSTKNRVGPKRGYGPPPLVGESRIKGKSTGVSSVEKKASGTSRGRGAKK